MHQAKNHRGGPPTAIAFAARRSLRAGRAAARKGPSNGTSCDAERSAPRRPSPSASVASTGRWTAPIREEGEKGQIQQHMPRRTVRRRDTRTQSAISNSERRSFGRRRAHETRPHGGALGGLNLGRDDGHTQNETGPTAQRHMALAGPPTPTIQGHGGYLGTTDDERRGRPSQPEGGAPARVLAPKATHTQHSLLGPRRVGARYLGRGPPDASGIGVKRESARRGDAMHHPRGFHRTVASPSRPRTLPTRGSTSEGSARGQTLRLRDGTPSDVAGGLV